MDISGFSTEFTLRKLHRDDIPAVLRLCEENPLYFEFCPPMATDETIADDMTALPPGMTKEQKYYVGFFVNGSCGGPLCNPPDGPPPDNWPSGANVPDVKTSDPASSMTNSTEKLIAVMDVVDGYPQPGTAFIGFFMTAADAQNKGIGSRIITDFTTYLKSEGFDTIRLAWVKGNLQAEHFWLKNGFTPLRETTSSAAANVILAEKKIQRPYLV